MKVLIIGRTGILYQTVLGLEEAGQEIVGIITAKAAPEYDKDEDDFADLAQRFKVPYFCCGNLLKEDVFKFIKDVGADIGVSVNWVGILKNNVLKCFKYGVLNAHMGDLPRYRGNACPNWAILNGESEIVLSIHFMEDGLLDCGRIVWQEHFPLKDDTYIGDVYNWSRESIPQAFINSLDLLEKKADWTLKYADPNDPSGFRCYPRRPEDGLIDWKKSADEICRLVRASSKPFEGAYTYNNGNKIVIWKVKVVDSSERYYAIPGQVCDVDKDNGTITVITGNGKLIIDGMGNGAGATLCPTDIICSIRERLG